MGINYKDKIDEKLERARKGEAISWSELFELAG